MDVGGPVEGDQSFSILGLILVIVMSVQYFGLISCVPRRSSFRSHLDRARASHAFSVVFARGLHRYFGFKSLYMGLYKSVGDVQGIDYWAAAELHSGMKGYVPEVENADGNPWIACDMRLFDQDFIAWTGDHDAHNLYEDKLFDGMGDEVKKKLFSVYQSFDTPEKEGAKARMLVPGSQEVVAHVHRRGALDTPWYRALLQHRRRSHFLRAKGPGQPGHGDDVIRRAQCAATPNERNLRPYRRTCPPTPHSPSSSSRPSPNGS